MAHHQVWVLRCLTQNRKDFLEMEQICERVGIIAAKMAAVCCLCANQSQKGWFALCSSVTIRKTHSVANQGAIRCFGLLGLRRPRQMQNANYIKKKPWAEGSNPPPSMRRQSQQLRHHVPASRPQLQPNQWSKKSTFLKSLLDCSWEPMVKCYMTTNLALGKKWSYTGSIETTVICRPGCVSQGVHVVTSFIQ